MRHIKKRREPKSFREWKAKSNTEWQASYDQLQRPEKRLLHEALIEEQGFVCCYCKSRVDLESSHIEHFRSQAHREDLALDYNNLFASCGRPQYDMTLPPQCGNKKADWYEEPVEEIIVSPLDENCELMFTYTRLGEIRATKNAQYTQRAKRTIELLGLDYSLLNAGRKSAIDTFISFVDDLNHDELRKLMIGLAEMDQYGRHEPFATTLRYMCREYMGVEV